MLSIWRRRLLLTRSFSAVVPFEHTTDPSSSNPPAIGTPRPRKGSSPASAGTVERVPVREDHGLYAFFRKKLDPDLVGEARYETLSQTQPDEKASGRAWRASELRLKSFKDLHTLWYILLRERNLLATQKEEARRLGVIANLKFYEARRCRKSMARIKAVLNERRRAYEGALQLAASERAEVIDQKLLEYHQNQYFEERKVLEEKAKTLGRRRPRRAVVQPVKPVEVDSNDATFKPEVPVEEPKLEVSAEEANDAATTPDARTKEKRQPTLSSASDLATAGMFGGDAVEKTNDRRRR